MAHAFLKSPTILYHPTLAPKGRLFDASAERPLQHPGDEWADSPAALPEGTGELTPDQRAAAESAVQTAAEIADLKAQIETLREERAVALTRAEDAEKAADDTRAAHKAEAEAHAKARDELRDANAEIVKAAARIAELEAEVAKVGEAQSVIDGLNQQIADLKAQAEKPAKAR